MRMVELSGSEVVNVSLDRIWEFVSDTSRVANCIPGVKAISLKDQDHFDADVEVAVGFIKNTYKLSVGINRTPKTAIDLSLSGSGGGGRMDGSAKVTFGDEVSAVRVSYNASITIAGPLAGLGARFIGNTSDKILKGLFDCIKRGVEQA